MSFRAQRRRGWRRGIAILPIEGCPSTGTMAIPRLRRCAAPLGMTASPLPVTRYPLPAPATRVRAAVYSRFALITRTAARALARSFQATVAPASQNLTALNSTAASAGAAAVGRSALQAAARSVAGRSASIRMRMAFSRASGGIAQRRWWLRRCRTAVSIRQRSHAILPRASCAQAVSSRCARQRCPGGCGRRGRWCSSTLAKQGAC